MTATIAPACEYRERSALDAAGGGVLRPGGIDLTARAIGHCALQAGARVLDLGCGAGVTVGHLRRSLGLDATGIDSSRTALARAAALPLVQGTARDLPFASGSVSAVLAECSLSLMPERERVLAECWRVLAPEGRLAITDLYARAPGAAAPLRSLPAACGAGMTTRDELARELMDQGFLEEVFEDHSTALAELASRLVMAGGSIAGIWAQRDAGPDERRRVMDAVRRARPGYFLLVAKKERAPRGGSEIHGR